MCQKSINEREREQETERRKVEALERIAARLEQLNGTVAKALEPLQNLGYIDNVAEKIAGELVNLSAVIHKRK
jgi:Mn-dependent DtxR family transcriptional regulator